VNQLINNITIHPYYDKIPLDPYYLLTIETELSYEKLMSSAMSHY